MAIDTNKVFDGPITQLINLLDMKCVYYLLYSVDKKDKRCSLQTLNKKLPILRRAHLEFKVLCFWRETFSEIGSAVPAK